jgi:HK97 family phage prohead protease/HK97 family phage major capsid protein
VTDKIVRFSTDITAADAERRTIVGTVVPYGSVGETSLGPVTFAAGSISRSDTVKLVLEHDMKRPIGRASGFVDGPERLVGTFRLSHTTAGSDALVEASDGLRDGLSVGARIREHTIDANGVMVVTAADLVEVSLVHTPAFSDAVVTQVAASTPEDGDSPDESEEDIVQNETTEVAAAEVAASPAPTVEAARPSMPYITAEPRDLKGLTAGGMLRAQIQAQMGSHDAQMLVQAALGVQNTTQDSGVIPVPLMREIISTIDNQRPFINSIDRQPLPASGMTFRIPKVTTAVSVGKQSAENAELPSTQGEIEDITVTVETFGGANKVSRQLIERSDPSYFDELLRQLAAKFANETDKAAHLAAATTAVTSAGAAGGGIYSAVVKGIADSYGVMRFEPNRLHVNPTGTASPTWFDLLSEVDDQGRPLFAAAAPQNAGGLVTQGSTNGTVAGLSVVVNPNATVNSQALVYPSAAATFYESAGAPVRVELSFADTLSVDVGVYGYVALALKHPTAFRKLTVTPAPGPE